MPTLHLIDGSGYVFRAYHALPPLTTSKGVPTGAVRGVASMLLKDLREQKPTHIAVCMDLDSKARRAAIYPEYKATRPPPPEDLVPQFKLVRDVVQALNLPMLEVSGYEADDIIATLAGQALAKGWEVVVVSGDKDLMQLVKDGHVRFWDGMKAQWFDDAAVKEKWGVAPSLVGDLLALTGDSVDNVPGVPGVGPKTAAALLLEHGSLDAVMAKAGEVKKPKLRENLLASVELVKISRRLVTLDEQVPLPVTVEDLARKAIDPDRARALFAELEMYSLLKELPAPVKPPAESRKVDVTFVRDAAGLEQLAQALEKTNRFALNVLLTGERPQVDPLVGFGISTGEATWFVPVGMGALGQAVLPEKKVLERLKGVLESTTILKDGHGLKAATTALVVRGVKLAGLGCDVEMASFLLNSARREHLLQDLARERLNTELPGPPLDSRKRPALSDAMPETVAPYAGHAAHAVAALVPILEAELARDESKKIWETVERPVVELLTRMEVAGIRVDVDALRSQAAEFEKEITKQVSEMYVLAGHEFNVNAPAQLADVLFGELNLPVLRKGKTGPSTDAEVLEKLAEQHPLPAKVLEYRTISKLKNTYLDTLPELVATDGRIHTTFNQLGAATGRLSSNDPNLQNIPIRTDLGRRIRAAFVAAPGQRLVSADYSQIELRILAHVSGDKALVESFSKGEDVHTRTAAEIYGVMPLLVSGEMRRVAKMINYAIAYGLSPYGLSTRLGIPTDEAKRVIDAYFQRYSGVKTWLETTVKRGKETGYVTTILGRKRQLADLLAKNPVARMAAERAAVNAPIQGTAADIVKLAMIAVDRVMTAEVPEARMLLQVHDELVFEVPEEKVEALAALAKKAMEGAVKLAVPLVVDVGHGLNWDEAH